MSYNISYLRARFSWEIGAALALFVALLLFLAPAIISFENNSFNLSIAHADDGGGDGGAGAAAGGVVRAT